LDKEPLYGAEDMLGVPVFGASWDLERVVREQSIEHVIVAFSTAPSTVLLRLLKRCDELHVRTSFVPRLYEQTTERLTVQRNVKYALDRVAAAGALLLLSPLMVTLAIVVRVSMGRPILYRQRRVGRDGELFDMLKFRSPWLTMSPLAASGPTTAAPDSGRSCGAPHSTSCHSLSTSSEVI
jgi:hypothetical protein